MTMTDADMTAKIEQGDGFIAALDQSGGSTPKALAGYGVDESAWSSEEEMYGLIHQMRSRIITSPAFASGKVRVVGGNRWQGCRADPGTQHLPGKCDFALLQSRLNKFNRQRDVRFRKVQLLDLTAQHFRPGLA